jgi:rhomboid-like protein
MSHAGTAIRHRFVGSGLSCLRWASPAQTLRSISAIPHGRNSFAWNILPGIQVAPQVSNRKPSLAKHRRFSTTTKTALRHGFVARAKESFKEKEEKGLAFQRNNLDILALRQIFGYEAPPRQEANQFLRVLHGRRVDGTLDLPLPAPLEELKERFPNAESAGLQWLRENHPIDEDAAIIKRIQREEKGQEDHNPSELQQRALDWGLFKLPEYHGPQSGHYQAPISEKEGDLYGQSTFDRMKAESMAKAEQEEAELQAEIDVKMAEAQKLHDEKSQALAERPEQGIEVSEEIRPPNSFEKWRMQQAKDAQSSFTLEEVEKISFLQRLLPSTVFVALVCIGSYVFAQYWSPPRRSDRMFPDVSLAFATVGAVVAANVAVYAAWKLPMFWRILDKYFVSTPGYPRAASMILNTFSHGNAKHLLRNMVGIVLFGLSLHEEVGRGWFLAIYFASGAIGSLASLTRFSLKKLYHTASDGASGSLLGIIGAYCWLHAK